LHATEAPDDFTRRPGAGREARTGSGMSRKQGLPERGRGAPHLFGDLTTKADDMGGRQSHASVSGRISIKRDVVPAQPHRPPHFMGMRPSAIAAGHRQLAMCLSMPVVEVAA
jgi:hypothetical protein